MSIDLYSEDLLAVDENGFERSEDEDDPHGLEEVIEGHIVAGGDEEDNNSGGDGDQADAGRKIKVPKKTRVIKNPQPKLDSQRLKGPKGVVALSNYFKDFKFNGKGHEKEDLDRVMHQMEHWAHRLFPSFTFNDFLERAEKVGNQAVMKTYVKRIRLGMLLDDPEELVDDDGDVNKGQPMEIDDPVDPPQDMFDDLFDRPPLPPSNVLPPRPLSPPLALSDEQLERMRQNRLLAMEKRLARQKAQEELNNSKQQTSEQVASALLSAVNSTQSSQMGNHLAEITQQNEVSIIGDEVESEKNTEPLSVSKELVPPSKQRFIDPNDQHSFMEDENIIKDQQDMSTVPISIEGTATTVASKLLNAIENTMPILETVSSETMPANDISDQLTLKITDTDNKSTKITAPVCH